MRILFVGESWHGSCARSLKEALRRRPDIVLDEVNEDLWFPRPHARWLRALSRLTVGAYRREFSEHVLARVREFRPDVLMAYKGNPVRADLLEAVRTLGVRTANVYPDCSPHAHGDFHRRAVGTYDLVISTKPYHPALWAQTYGYRNRCAFVPQGYDATLHQVDTPPIDQPFDVVVVATWRAEYGRLMSDLARRFAADPIRVAIGGLGWERHRAGLPPSWVLLGGLVGRSYVEALRKGRICIAPLTREVSIRGVEQPGDVDTTRTYELAAAHCFFLHRRTAYAQGVYDEQTEVPMFDDAAELTAQVRYYLNHEAERRRMAAAAHLRAVPSYSLDARAEQIVLLLRSQLA